MDDGSGDVCYASIATEASPYHCDIHHALHPVAMPSKTDAGSGYTSTVVTLIHFKIDRFTFRG